MLEPLYKINSLKFMTSSEIKVASQVQFVLVDVRVNKKPRLKECFRSIRVDMP